MTTCYLVNFLRNVEYKGDHGSLAASLKLFYSR